jgi:hypothetical protein
VPVVGVEADIVDRYPDERQAGNLLAPADDIPVAQVEPIVAGIDLDGAETALVDGALRADALV